MDKKSVLNRSWLLALVLAAVLLVGLATKAGSFLVVDEPRPADVILVLAGETHYRPALALQFLARGLGRRIVLDVRTNYKIYEFTERQLAEKYVHGLPQATAISLCPIEGLSTRDEALEVAQCLEHRVDERVLIVTSDFDTRRAL